MADLEVMKSIEKKAEVKKKEPEAKTKDEAMKSQELSVLTASLGQLQNSLTVANDSVKDGNEQLKQQLTLKNCTKKELQEAQSKIEMGLKRRAELEMDQEVLNKKFKEIEETKVNLLQMMIDANVLLGVVFAFYFESEKYYFSLLSVLFISLNSKGLSYLNGCDKG